jgi:hypothetical protein
MNDDIDNIKVPETDLRHEVHILLAQAGVYGRGAYDILLPRLEKHLGRRINKRSLGMAMTGHRDWRKWASSREILQGIKAVLSGPQADS